MHLIVELTKLIEFVKLSPKYMAPVSIATGSLIFGPQKFTDALGVSEFVHKYRSLLGVLFLFSFTLLLSNIVVPLCQLLFGKIKERYWLHTYKKRLHNLTPDEIMILNGYVSKIICCVFRGYYCYYWHFFINFENI